MEKVTISIYRYVSSYLLDIKSNFIKTTVNSFRNTYPDCFLNSYTGLEQTYF